MPVVPQAGNKDRILTAPRSSVPLEGRKTQHCILGDPSRLTVIEFTHLEQIHYCLYMNKEVMSTKSVVLLMLGACAGSAITYLVCQSSITQAEADLKEARAYQQEFAREKGKISARNSEIERRLATLEKSTYDRQEIRSCMLNATILSSAVDAYRLGQPLSNVERGMIDRYMSSAIVAAQGKSMQSALSILLDEQRKVSEECLDGARIGADPIGKLSVQPPAS